MKYYTKEWYALVQKWGLGGGFKKIPDKDYSEGEIKAMYRDKLKKEIEDDRRDYNSPPVCLDLSDRLSEDTFSAEDWIIVDEVGEPHVPENAQQVRENLERQQKQALEAFENRPPFDENETRSWFRSFYRAELRNARNFYPSWLSEQVDPRLIALGYLPESAYKKYTKEIRDAKAECQRIERRAEKGREKQQIPEEIDRMFWLHDSALLSLRKNGSNIVMILTKDGKPSGEGEYRKLTFKNAEILEKDPLHPRKSYKEIEHKYFSRIYFLYHELYKTANGYELHILFCTPKDLAYLTLRFSEVICEDLAEI